MYLNMKYKLQKYYKFVKKNKKSQSETWEVMYLWCLSFSEFSGDCEIDVISRVDLHFEKGLFTARSRQQNRSSQVLSAPFLSVRHPVLARHAPFS